jgi:hypothetical protein
MRQFVSHKTVATCRKARYNLGIRNTCPILIPEESVTSGILSDWEILNLIEVCREMLKSQHDWLVAYGDCYFEEGPPNPCNFRHYLQVKRVVNEAMKYRRAHRKAVAHVLHSEKP